jgi:hypothetical protein
MALREKGNPPHMTRRIPAFMESQICIANALDDSWACVSPYLPVYLQYSWSALARRRSFRTPQVKQNCKEPSNQFRVRFKNLYATMDPQALRSGKVAVLGFGMVGYLAKIEFHE